jgi:NTE family protein
VHAADPPDHAASAVARPATGTLADGVSPSASVAAGPRLIAAVSRRPSRTAFVLAGGASLGAMKAGMLNAAYIASGAQTVQTAKALADVWRGLRRRDLFPIHPPTLIAGLSNHRDQVVLARPLSELISRHLQLERLEDAEVRFTS